MVGGKIGLSVLPESIRWPMRLRASIPAQLGVCHFRLASVGQAPVADGQP